MSDFDSSFWSWFISIAVIGGIIGLVWLLLANSKVKLEPGQDAQAMGHVWDGNLEELNTPLPAWWLKMFYLTIVFSIIYLILYPGMGAFPGFLGWTQLGEYAEEIAQAEENYQPIFANYAEQDIKMLADNPQAMKTGKRLFMSYCSQCHGSDARGSTGFPNLRDEGWLWGGEPAQIKASILNGRNGVMPAWKAPLGEQGVKEVAAYVLKLAGRKHDETLAAAGQGKFAMCIGCHGANGEGNPVMGAADLTDKAWVFGASPRAIEDSIANGRNGVMPAHKDFLGEDKVHLLAAYVYSLKSSD